MTEEQVYRFYEVLAKIISHKEGVDLKIVNFRKRTKDDPPHVLFTEIREGKS